MVTTLSDRDNRLIFLSLFYTIRRFSILLSPSDSHQVRSQDLPPALFFIFKFSSPEIQAIVHTVYPTYRDYGKIGIWHTEVKYSNTIFKCLQIEPKTNLNEP